MNAKKSKPVCCSRCGIDLTLPGVTAAKRDGKLYCDACSAQLDAQVRAQADIKRFSEFMAGKRLLIPLDGEYMQWSKSIEVDRETGALWLVHSRSVGASGASFAATSIDIFEEEPCRLTAEEALRLAEEAHPGVSEFFEGLTDTNGMEYIDRYTKWAHEQSRFAGCGSMASQLIEDFRKIGIPLKDTLVHYGAPLYFGYEEKTGRYFVREPAERSPGTVTLFSDTIAEEFRWFLLEYVVRVWAEREELNSREKLKASWKWLTPYDYRIPQKEMILQKLSRIYPPEHEKMQAYTERILRSLNRDKGEAVRWMSDNDSMTVYMPSEKHPDIRDLQAEQQKLEAQLHDKCALGREEISLRLAHLALEHAFFAAGSDMAAQLTRDMKKLGITAEQLKGVLPSKFGHGSAGYWAEDTEEDHGNTYTYPICSGASTEDFRWMMLERIVRLTVNWPQLNPEDQISLRIKRLIPLYDRSDSHAHELVLDPHLSAYIEEKIGYLEKSRSKYNWQYSRKVLWMIGTPKAGTNAPPLFRPGQNVDNTGDAPSLFLYGDISGHGDQISAGRITEGEAAGHYYWSVVNDGYPNRTAGGGFTHYLPYGLVKDGCVPRQELFRWIREDWSYASYLRMDEKDDVILDLDHCIKLFSSDPIISEEGLRWQVDNGCAVILGCEGNPTELIIPEKLGNYTVQEICADAFCNIHLRKVTIPSTVARIGAHAFGYGCTAPGSPASYRQYTPAVTICSRNWSVAKRYAQENNLPFEVLRPNTTGTKIPVHISMEERLSMEGKHWIGVESTGSVPSNDAHPNSAPASHDRRAAEQNASVKFHMDIQSILMTCFFAVIAVITFFAKGWLLGTVLGLIAAFMPIASYYDFKKEQKRNAFRDTMKRRRK